MNRREFLKYAVTVPAALLATSAMSTALPGKTWGISTLNAKQALGNISERRFTDLISRDLYEAYIALREHQTTDQLDKISQEQMLTCLSDVMDQFHRQRHVVEYQVVCDASNNPYDTKYLHVDVYWKTVRSAGSIFHFELGRV